ncbi:MAG: tRNA (adenosine(37)-N6)-threonylcarbamoyltransferase complex dimerization subunit type 1 TsaB [Oscillospiraceae bacterium]|nr:tRNA (adenosine(37)-N6)-threonylcarbamoyltransferase complex dimerization subunit type 1 TsaB [Oscillospiraceae bacterium]
MLMLGMDTSAVAASAALWEDERLIGESFVNVKLTHSQTILPMVHSLFASCGRALSQVDRFAVSTGPGSFTGLRIGISAVKGMAFCLKKDCIPVSTLEALAYNLLGQDCIAVAAMDARCQQVYTASFLVGRDSVRRLTEDAALSIQELWEWVGENSGALPVVLVGDGAGLCYNSWKGEKALLAPEQLRFQRASSVCAAALRHPEEKTDPAQLVPQYLRLPQAQRELLKKQKKA